MSDGQRRENSATPSSGISAATPGISLGSTQTGTSTDIDDIRKTNPETALQIERTISEMHRQTVMLAAREGEIKAFMESGHAASLGKEAEDSLRRELDDIDKKLKSMGIRPGGEVAPGFREAIKARPDILAASSEASLVRLFESTAQSSVQRTSQVFRETEGSQRTSLVADEIFQKLKNPEFRGEAIVQYLASLQLSKESYALIAKEYKEKYNGNITEVFERRLEKSPGQKACIKLISEGDYAGAVESRLQALQKAYQTAKTEEAKPGTALRAPLTSETYLTSAGDYLRIMPPEALERLKYKAEASGTDISSLLSGIGNGELADLYNARRLNRQDQIYAAELHILLRNPELNGSNFTDALLDLHKNGRLDSVRKAFQEKYGQSLEQRLSAKTGTPPVTLLPYKDHYLALAILGGDKEQIHNEQALRILSLRKPDAAQGDRIPHTGKQTGAFPDKPDLRALNELYKELNESEQKRLYQFLLKHSEQFSPKEISPDAFEKRLNLDPLTTVLSVRSGHDPDYARWLSHILTNGALPDEQVAEYCIKREFTAGEARLIEKLLQSPQCDPSKPEYDPTALLTTLYSRARQYGYTAEIWQLIEFEYNRNRGDTDAFKKDLRSRCSSPEDKKALDLLIAGDDMAFVTNRLETLANSKAENRSIQAQLVLSSLNQDGMQALEHYMASQKPPVSLSRILEKIGDRDLKDWALAIRDGDQATVSAISLKKVLESPDSPDAGLVPKLLLSLKEQGLLEKVSEIYIARYGKDKSDLKSDALKAAAWQDRPLIEALFSNNPKLIEQETFFKYLGLRGEKLDPVALNLFLLSLSPERRAELLAEAREFADKNFDEIVKNNPDLNDEDKTPPEVIARLKAGAKNGCFEALMFLACDENRAHYHRMMQILEKGPIAQELAEAYGYAWNQVMAQESLLRGVKDHFISAEHQRAGFETGTESQIRTINKELGRATGAWWNPIAQLSGLRSGLQQDLANNETLLEEIRQHKFVLGKAAADANKLVAEIRESNERGLSLTWNGDTELGRQEFIKNQPKLQALGEIMNSDAARGLPSLERYNREAREVIKAYDQAARNCDTIQKYAKVTIAVTAGVTLTIMSAGAAGPAAIALIVTVGMTGGEAIYEAINGRSASQIARNAAWNSLENFLNAWGAAGLARSGLYHGANTVARAHNASFLQSYNVRFMSPDRIWQAISNRGVLGNSEILRFYVGAGSAAQAASGITGSAVLNYFNPQNSNNQTDPSSVIAYGEGRNAPKPPQFIVPPVMVPERPEERKTSPPPGIPNIPPVHPAENTEDEDRKRPPGPPPFVYVPAGTEPPPPPVIPPSDGEPPPPVPRAPETSTPERESVPAFPYSPQQPVTAGPPEERRENPENTGDRSTTQDYIPPPSQPPVSAAPEDSSSAQLPKAEPPRQSEPERENTETPHFRGNYDPQASQESSREQKHPGLSAFSSSPSPVSDNTVSMRAAGSSFSPDTTEVFSAYRYFAPQPVIEKNINNQSATNSDINPYANKTADSNLNTSLNLNSQFSAFQASVRVEQSNSSLQTNSLYQYQNHGNVRYQGQNQATQQTQGVSQGLSSGISDTAAREQGQTHAGYSSNKDLSRNDNRSADTFVNYTTNAHSSEAAATPSQNVLHSSHRNETQNTEFNRHKSPENSVSNNTKVFAYSSSAETKTETQTHSHIHGESNRQDLKNAAAETFTDRALSPDSLHRNSSSAGREAAASVSYRNSHESGNGLRSGEAGVSPLTSVSQVSSRKQGQFSSALNNPDREAYRSGHIPESQQTGDHREQSYTHSYVAGQPAASQNTGGPESQGYIRQESISRVSAPQITENPVYQEYRTANRAALNDIAGRLEPEDYQDLITFIEMMRKNKKKARKKLKKVTDPRLLNAIEELKAGILNQEAPAGNTEEQAEEMAAVMLLNEAAEEIPAAVANPVRKGPARKRSEIYRNARSNSIKKINNIRKEIHADTDIPSSIRSKAALYKKLAASGDKPRLSDDRPAPVNETSVSSKASLYRNLKVKKKS